MEFVRSSVISRSAIMTDKIVTAQMLNASNNANVIKSWCIMDTAIGSATFLNANGMDLTVPGNMEQDAVLAFMMNIRFQLEMCFLIACMSWA